MKKLMLLLFPVLLWAPGLSAQSGADAARAWREAHGPEILRDFVELLEIPNVASDLENTRKNARHIAAAFAERGVVTEILDLPDVPPVVYGELLTPGAERTLLIYVHYDGQPVDPSRWTHPPFEPVLYTASMEAGGKPRPLPADGEPIDPEWRIYARSAGDDKVPIPALLAALDALQESEIPLTSNIRFFFEGEEEAGSPHLRRYLETYSEKLAGDLWLFCDGPIHQSGSPQIVFGVRGVTGLEVTVYGASRSLHSGHYGNWAPVPGQLLAHLLASMKAPDGQVLIDGFYDTTAPITAAERAVIADLPAVDESLRRELGLTWSEGDNAPLAERLLLPSLTIRGLSSGNVGAKARNIIPSSATASLGVRLAKGNDPSHMLDLVEAHIAKEGFHIVRDEPDHAARLAHDKIALVRRGGGYPAVRTSMDLPVVQSVVQAIAEVSGDEAVLLPTFGGSLPLFHFLEVLDQPVLILPIANHDDNQHAPDENLRLANLWYGIEMYAALFTMPE